MAGFYCYLITIFGIFVPSILFVYFRETQINRMTSRSTFYETQQSTHRTTILADWTYFDKFVSSDTSGEGCGGVGNMIFRIASLYGIAKKLNRAACFQEACAEEYHVELFAMFPNLQKFPLKTRCWKESAKQRFNPPQILAVDFRLNVHKNDKFVHLRTGYLLSHRFFHHARQDILTLLDFSDAVDGLVDAYARQLFDNDNSVKVCVHMRNGDFYDPNHPLLPSDESFLLAAVKFLTDSIRHNHSNTNIDVLLLSSEFEYANDIKEKIKRLNVTNKILMARELNRIENINLAARHCDYMLLTCSGSTFGWWMSYLMPVEKQKNVYYNSVLFKPNHRSKANSFHEGDFFPAAWNRLVLNKEKKEVFIEDRQKPLIPL
ncbi:hypothetical protein M3Y95_00319100 [Aphelenchoides besseyi]|nr:hypothetical protein M3Y95_00319100 [Aphelenchoides besseyi]